MLPNTGLWAGILTAFLLPSRAYAASLLGRYTAEVRQPLWAIMPETPESVQRAMRGAGRLN